MIDVRNIGKDFVPRKIPEEGFAPQAPQQFGGGQPGVSVGQPQPFTPVQSPTASSIPVGIPTQQPFTPVTPPGGQMEGMIGGMSQGGGIPGQSGTAVQPGEGGFPYPEQWGQAGDIYGKLAGGIPGMPDPSAIWGGYQQQAGDLSRELAEQAGMGMGGRYGSALQRNIADVGMRAGERFGGEIERLRMGDIQGQRQAMLGAAGGLSGLGGAQAMLPGQLAGQAMGLGGQYQGMQQQEYDRQMQEFMRTQPEYSPYLPYMQQGAQVPYGPQGYQPGFASNMMDISGLMSMYGMLNRQQQPSALEKAGIAGMMPGITSGLASISGF